MLELKTKILGHVNSERVKVLFGVFLCIKDLLFSFSGIEELSTCRLRSPSASYFVNLTIDLCKFWMPSCFD